MVKGRLSAAGVIRNREKKDTETAAAGIAAYLKDRGVSCFVSEDGKDLPEGIDCVFVLGGDGTMLRAAGVLLKRQLPLIGINFGNLGYLAEIGAGHMYEAIDRILAGDYEIEKRMMLRGRIQRADGTTDGDTALNEIMLRREGPLRSYRIVNYVNASYLNSYSADGIILSTATGSTGYNLSAGGPIVSPPAEVILMTPLAPHSLISRSIILSGSDTICTKIGEGSTGYEPCAVTVSFDGRKGIPLGTGDSIEVSRSPSYTNIMKLSHVSFLEVLRNKMAGGL